MELHAHMSCYTNTYYILTLIDFLSSCRMANFEKLDFKGSGVNTAKKQSGLNEYASSLFDPSLTWKDVKWLRNVTKLPIVIKGVLTG